MRNFEWDTYWDNLIKHNKLETKVRMLDQLDKKHNRVKRTKDICKNIYENFQSIKLCLKNVEKETIILLKDVKNVYLQSSRVKTVNSLIIKVINRRYKYMNLRNSRYNKIDDKNYVDVITDLVGVRLIIAHMGDWENVHDQLLRIFPMDQEYDYDDNVLIERNENAMQALLPHAYYLEGENTTKELFEKNGITPKMSEVGYRSIHYTVTYRNYYLEIQLRPLYMEQWCMCSHNYVYKKEGEKHYNFLQNISNILEGMTDVSGEIGDFMRDVYEDKFIIRKEGNSFFMNAEGIKSIDKLLKMCNDYTKELELLKERIELVEQ